MNWSVHVFKFINIVVASLINPDLANQPCKQAHSGWALDRPHKKMPQKSFWASSSSHPKLHPTKNSKRANCLALPEFLLQKIKNREVSLKFFVLLSICFVRRAHFLPFFFSCSGRAGKGADLWSKCGYEPWPFPIPSDLGVNNLSSLLWFLHLWYSVIRVVYD